MTDKTPKQTFEVLIVHNTLPGGAWLCTVTNNGTPFMSAWKNASAAKRHAKSELLRVTSRKTIKLTVTQLDDLGKPQTIGGHI